MKIAAILLLLLGEALSVLTELYASRNHARYPLGVLLGWGSVAMALGGAMILSGYVLGYRAFQNIWIVTAVSIGGIIVVEPALAWFFFREAPTRGAALGLVLGITGMICSLVVK